MFGETRALMALSLWALKVSLNLVATTLGSVIATAMGIPLSPSKTSWPSRRADLMWKAIRKGGRSPHPPMGQRPLFTRYRLADRRGERQNLREVHFESFGFRIAAGKLLDGLRAQGAD